MRKGLDPETLAIKSGEGYELLAPEYYLADRHPTCANFSELHRLVLKLLQPRIKPGKMYLEVGSGAGQIDLLVGEDNAFLTDLSEQMLMLAKQRTGGRVRCLQMNAFKPNLPKVSFGGVAAFLADPYNHEAFYTGIREVIEPGGFLALTLPNHTWALALRGRLGFLLDETTFISIENGSVTVPSITRPIAEQVDLLSRSGYTPVIASSLSIDMLSEITPSHHVRFAARELGVESTAIHLLDLYIAVRTG